jgi:uncharacterized protein
MTASPPSSCTAFAGRRVLAAGPLTDVALAVKAAEAGGSAPDAILVFDDATGRVIDLDLRGSDADIVARYRPRPDAQHTAVADDAGEPRGRGRPKLGVIAREVTLLPRHWEWLAAQPGGASAALRRLVEDARKRADPRQAQRAAQEASYRFMHAIAGDLPGYEEATRALFADDRPRLEQWTADWPADIRAYALRLAAPTRP